MANGYVQLRRGLEEHLGAMTDGELKVYIKLLFRAKFSGKNVGTAIISATDIADELNQSRSYVYKALQRLKMLKYINYERGSNQYKDTSFNILKYKVLYVEHDKATVKASDEAHDKAHDKARVRQNASTSGKEASKNVEECIRKNNNNTMYYYLSKLLFSLIKENDAKAKKPNFDKWTDEIEKIIRLDKRTKEEVETVIRWSQEDSFWKSNILSPRKLRKNFTQLTIRKEQDETTNKNFTYHRTKAEPGEYDNV